MFNDGVPILSKVVTQEFQISVTPVGEDEYLVRTEQVAPGVPLAEEQTPWPVDDWLNFARRLDPCQVEPTSDYRLLGQHLYQALFQGTLRDSWMTAQAIAQHQRSQLRFRLGVRGPYLSRLPWEILSVEGRPLTTSPDLIFSRYQSLTGVGHSASLLQELRLEPGQPLRILLAIAMPEEPRQPRSAGDSFASQLRQQALQLQKELSSNHGSTSLGGRYTTSASKPNRRELAGAAERDLLEIQLTVLHQPSRTQLAQSLEQGNYQIFHYIGNSPAEMVGSPLELINSQTSLLEPLRGDDLAGLLVNNGVRVGVFQFCRRALAQTTVIDPTRAHHISALLIKQGVPGVLTLTEQVPDEISMSVIRRFYRQLKQGLPIDLSLNRVRQELAATHGLERGYWALPILYLHPEFDGYLMLPPMPPPTKVVLAEPPDLTLPRPLLPSLPAAWGMQDETVPWLPAGSELSQLEESYAAETNDELLDLIDDLEYDGEPSYEEDAALVSGLLRQLSQGEATVSLELEDTLLPAPRDENLLPNATEETWLYTALPENPLYQDFNQEQTHLISVEQGRSRAANTHANSMTTPRATSATPKRLTVPDRAPPARSPTHRALASIRATPWRQSLRDWTELWLVLATLGLTSLAVLVLGLFSNSSSWFNQPAPAPQPSVLPANRSAPRG